MPVLQGIPMRPLAIVCWRLVEQPIQTWPMLATVRSAAIHGIEAFDVLVEVDVALGLPQWTIVGLPAGGVKESRERVGAALANAGLPIPPRRVTVNLAPADI